MYSVLIDDCEFQVIPAVNFHFWKSCNMNCKFCFAQFNDRTTSYEKSLQITRELAFDVVSQMAKNSVKKITFVGGEPFLCPWFDEILSFAKSLSLTTMVVSNGSMLSRDWIASNADNIDWITLSIDSLNDSVNTLSGRSIRGQGPLSKTAYYDAVQMVKEHGVKLKINTTVSSYNLNEDLTDFILFAKPNRWKIFQVLNVKGQNDLFHNDCSVTSVQFTEFIKKHTSSVQGQVKIVAEDNEAMTNSYLMIDPAGCFFDNSKGYYHYSKPIWDVGWQKALVDVDFSIEKFVDRDGSYNWD